MRPHHDEQSLFAEHLLCARLYLGRLVQFSHSYLIDGGTESYALRLCILSPPPSYRRLLLVLAGDDHRRPPRCSNDVNSKGKPDLDREIRQRAPWLADAG